MDERALRAETKDWLVVLLLAFLSLAMTFPLCFHLNDHVPSDLRDPLYTIWLLSWEVRAGGSGFAHFSEANIFYPHHDTLLYGDSLPAITLLGSPVLLLSGNPVLAYNVLFILSFFFCGLGMYFLVRRLTASRASALMAALIFAFFPYRFAHISHLELLYFGWMPFCFLFLHRFFEAPTVRNVLGAAFFYLLQVFSCSYTGEHLTLFAAFMVLYFAFKRGYWRKGFFWWKTGLLAVLSAAPLVPYFYSYVKLHERMFFTRPAWEVKFFSAELQHFVAVPAWNVLWGWLTGRLGAQEWQLYPGLIPVLLTIFWWLRTKQNRGQESVADAQRKGGWVWWDASNALLFVFIVVVGITGGFEWKLAGLHGSVHQLKNPVLLLLVSLVMRVLLDKHLRSRWRDFFRSVSPAEKYYLFLTAAAWLLSFGPVIKILGREIIGGPYGWLYSWVPGFQNLRVPSRFAVLMMLGLAVLSGWGVRLLLEKWQRPWRKTAGTGILALLVLADYASFPIPLAKVNVGDRVPKIYKAVRELPRQASLVELPMPAQDWDESEEAAPVYYSIFHWKNIVNGYSGYAPPGYRIVREAMDQFPSTAAFELLDGLEIEYLLIHTQGYRAEKGLEMVRRLRSFTHRVELLVHIDGDFLVRRLPAAPRKREEKASIEVGDRKIWKAAASLNGARVGLAFDGDLKTGWSTGYPQRQGDYFSLDLGSPVTLQSVELFLGNNPLDFPRSFVLEGSLDGGQWIPLRENSSFFPQLDRSMIEDFSQYEVDIPFERQELRYLRIRLTRSHEARHWSINEIICRD